MPIIPSFELSQDDEFVFITINIPYVKISDVEIISHSVHFSFYCKPYLLRLELPYEIEDTEVDERFKAVYDMSVKHGTITAHLPKKERGLHFPNLDLKTFLMKSSSDFKSKKSVSTPLIEILPDDELQNVRTTLVNTCNDDGNQKRSSPDFDNDIQTAMDELRISRYPCYGFNSQYSRVLGALREESVVMIEIPDPDGITEVDRRRHRIAAEYALFDVDRYLGDYFGAHSDSIYVSALAYDSFWDRQWFSWKLTRESATANPAGTELLDSFEEVGGFSDAEKDVLGGCSGIELRNREYLISSGSKQEKSILLTMADLLFAFCFECRMTCGDFSVESAMNIARLSCSCSWLESYNTFGDDARTVIVHCARRSLIYPYLRVWKLTRKVLSDVCKVLLLGRRSVLKCLLEMRRIFQQTDSHYMLNKLFIDDYCVWVQQVDDESLSLFANEFNTVVTEMEGDGTYKGRDWMQLNLSAIEDWAKQCQVHDCGEDTSENTDDDSSGDEEYSSDSDEADSDHASSDDEDDGVMQSQSAVPLRLHPTIPVEYTQEVSAAESYVTATGAGGLSLETLQISRKSGQPKLQPWSESPLRLTPHSPSKLTHQDASEKAYDISEFDVDSPRQRPVIEVLSSVEFE